MAKKSPLHSVNNLHLISTCTQPATHLYLLDPRSTTQCRFTSGLQCDTIYARIIGRGKHQKAWKGTVGTLGAVGTAGNSFINADLKCSRCSLFLHTITSTKIIRRLTIIPPLFSTPQCWNTRYNYNGTP